jgi:hypothetical protein
VYDALAGQLAAVGSDAFTARRQAVTGALDTAYDELLTARAAATGLNRHRARLLGTLNASLPVAEAAITLGLAGTRPSPLVVSVVSRLADAIRDGTPPPMIPPPWDDSPAMLALRDALAGSARGVWGGGEPPHEQGGSGGDRPPGGPVRARPRRPVGQALFEELGAGTLGRIFTLRLMACMGVAGLVSEVWRGW